MDDSYQTPQKYMRNIRKTHDFFFFNRM